MNQYKLKVKTSVGDILHCEFYSPLPVWEICKMFEEQCNCEILKLEKIKPTLLSLFLTPLPKSIAYN